MLPLFFGVRQHRLVGRRPELSPALRLLLPVALVRQWQAAALTLLGDHHLRANLLAHNVAADGAEEPARDGAQVPTPTLALEVPPYSCRVEDLPVAASRASELEIQVMRPDIPEVGHGVRRTVDEH